MEKNRERWSKNIETGDVVLRIIARDKKKTCCLLLIHVQSPWSNENTVYVFLLFFFHFSGEYGAFLSFTEHDGVTQSQESCITNTSTNPSPYASWGNKKKLFCCSDSRLFQCFFKCMKLLFSICRLLFSRSRAFFTLFTFFPPLNRWRQSSGDEKS